METYLLLWCIDLKVVYDEQDDDKHILPLLIMNRLTWTSYRWRGGEAHCIGSSQKSRTRYRWRGGEVHCMGSSQKSGTVLASESRQAVTSIIGDEVVARATILTGIGNAGIEEQFTIKTLWYKSGWNRKNWCDGSYYFYTYLILHWTRAVVAID